MLAVRPTTLSDHAVDRYLERWCNIFRCLSSKVLEIHRRHLLSLLPSAIFVEDVPDERQSIWSVDLDWGYLDLDTRPTALLVVDYEGKVRTVLPPYAQRPAGRR